MLRKINFIILLCFSLSILLFSSCEKVAGPGGSSTIVGRVWIMDYNSVFTEIRSEYWAEDQSVFIMYGNDTIPSNEVHTGYNGTYKFEFLQEGQYTIYCMSKDTNSLSPSGNIPVKISLQINQNGDDIIAPTITIVD